MRKLGAALAALALAACAHRPDAPAVGNEAGAPRPSGAICSICGCRAAADVHRQYCDERRRRYYYFDVKTKQYFWENGDLK